MKFKVKLYGGYEDRKNVIIHYVENGFTVKYDSDDKYCLMVKINKSDLILKKLLEKE